MFYIPFLLILPASVYGIGQPHYECGENGRFEYCIDGIPGCIVGCHCHPGYYFDTDTKICEPNAKMVQEYRRQFFGAAPTRVPEVILPMNELDLEPTPTTTTLNPQENTAKESNDLGDWLYNQFFKTIESQVINSSNSTETPKPETRRSNREPTFKKKRQKKNKSKSKKNKKKDMRRKLLRITEDDSLFESSSSDSSEDSSDESNSSGSDSSSSSSDSSSGSDKKGGDHKHEHKDKEHGHRKILVLNKKKKPPLPSFIFLPNMQTPFFAPIGLAPPPMPMYPMVPVPPMPVPPVFPFPAPPVTQCSVNNNKSSEATTQKPEEKETEAASQSTTENTTTTTSTTAPESLRMRSGKRHNNREKRKKLLQGLQQLKALQMRKQAQPEIPDFINDDTHADDQLSGIPDTLLPIRPPSPATEGPPPENVDFKYLAQLIHKMGNDNKTGTSTKLNETPVVPSRRYGEQQLDNYHRPPSENSMNTRPSFGNNRHLEAPDDSYYTKLGHQIASLIRTVDATGEQRFNIEVERQRTPPLVRNPQPQPQTFEQTNFIMDHNYTPRSYWERSVRSLLEHLQPDGGEQFRRNINEDNLFNLESRVETIATTARTLSLNDLENVVFLIDKVKSKLRRSTKVPITPTTKNYDNLNINLLPHLYEHSKLGQIYEYELKKNMPAQLNQINSIQVAQKNYSDSKALKHLMDNSQKKDLSVALIRNFQPISRVDFKKKSTIEKAPKKIDFKDFPSYNLKNLANIADKLMKIPAWKRKIYQNDTLNQNDITNIREQLNHVNKRNNLPNGPWLEPSLVNIINIPDGYRKKARKPIRFLSIPRKHTYHRNKLYLDNNNRFLQHTESLSMPLPAPAPSALASASHTGAPARYYNVHPPSSYFHREIQHFDMFEN